jgi:hypothetical protein
MTLRNLHHTKQRKGDTGREYLLQYAAGMQYVRPTHKQS